MHCHTEYTNTKIIVLCVCGLPACGKSTLIRAIAQTYRTSSSDHHPTSSTITKVHHIEYDRIYNAIFKSRKKEHDRNCCTHSVIPHDSLDDDDSCNEWINELAVQSETTPSMLARHHHHHHLPIPTNCADATTPSDEDGGANDNHQSDDDDDDGARHGIAIWRESRAVVMQILPQLLLRAGSGGVNYIGDNRPPATEMTTSPETTVLLLLDDNFYLKSMRKQIYRLCSNHVVATTTTTNPGRDDMLSRNKSNTVYFGTIYIDTPLPICLQRNQARSTSGLQAPPVSQHTIQKMYERFEAPVNNNHSMTPTTSKRTATWEQAVLQVSTQTTSSIQEQVLLVQNFIQNILSDTTGSAGWVVTPSTHFNDDNDETLRIEQSRRQQDQFLIDHSTRHHADQFWRQCVTTVAQYSRDKVSLANQIRKCCIQELSQQQQQFNDPSTHHNRLLWWNMFVQGRPNMEQQQPHPWLTDHEQEMIRNDLSF
jgi:tRNA uridine 5-carbamoylmethylation protein Kti12